ncbi:hypothetical protein [Streptomyces venezuelae]|uniref:hypothetical protein n=1 Tax=Streptomyces venezuelae TaxID=54571 RepID=UPI0036647335
MPSPPHLPIGAWWAIDAVLVGLFLAFYLSLSSGRGYRITTSLGPIVGVLGASALAAYYHWTLDEVLPIYGSVLAGFLLAGLGRREELRKSIQAQTDGDPPTFSFATRVQVVAAVVLCGGLGIWLAS